MPCQQPLFAPACSTLIVQPAFAEMGYHTSANKFDFLTSGDSKRSATFLWPKRIIGPGHRRGRPGRLQYKVVPVDRSSRTVSDLIAHTRDEVDVIFDPTGFNKAIDVKFNAGVMFIVDFGVFEPGLNIQQNGTGKVWVVKHQGLQKPTPPLP